MHRTLGIGEIWIELLTASVFPSTFVSQSTLPRKLSFHASFRTFIGELRWQRLPAAVAARETALVYALSMNKSLAFFGRRELIENLCALYAQRKHVLIVGIEGIGKTALLRQVSHSCPMLHLYKFTRVELPPLTRVETSALIENAVAQSNIQADAREHTAYLNHLSKGIPRILEELLIELAARKYRIDRSFGRHLLELDRRIHEIADANA